MTDIDKQKTWGEMSDAEKGALLLARVKGATLQTMAHGSDWMDKDFSNNKFNGEYAYRIKPEPVVGEEGLEVFYSDGFGVEGVSGSDWPATHRITFTTIDGKIFTGTFTSLDGHVVKIEGVK